MSPRARGTRRRRARLAGLALAASLAPCGCRPGTAGCSRAPAERREASTPTLAAEAPLAKLEAGPFETLARNGDVALPPGCRLEPPVRATRTATKGLVFLAPEGAFGALVGMRRREGVAEARGALFFDATRAAPRVDDVPWPAWAEAPALARVEGAWIAAATRPDGPAAASIVVSRNGAPTRVFATGDGLATTDLRCAAESCALLTTRADVASVAAPGASVFFFDARDAAAPPHRVDVVPTDPRSPASPLALAGLAAEPGTPAVAALVALESREALTLFRASRETAAEVARVGAEPRWLDALALGPADHPTLLGLGVAGDPSTPRCAPAARTLVIARSGAPRVTIETTAPPVSGFVRPLARGAVAAWIAPVDCQRDERLVVHAMLLDASGAPASGDVAVADATGVALATRDDELELFLRTPDEVLWVRGRCP